MTGPIKNLRIAVDHGNRNIKSLHFVFTSGINVLDKKPARGEKFLQYGGKYYTLSEKRIPYQRDKTTDDRFYVLTLFAIAMELEHSERVQENDMVQVDLSIGLPPKHYAELCDKYEGYFKAAGIVQEINYNGKHYHACIRNVRAFPQDYAALVTILNDINAIPKAVGIDIGGFTTDYLLIRRGKTDMDFCDSLEMGVITMYNEIRSKINSEYDMLLEDSDIDSIINGETDYYDNSVVKQVENLVQDFVTDLLASIRERGIDTRSTFTIFIGGGALLLRSFLKKADRLGKYRFIDDLKANAIGFDILYRMTMGRDLRE